jgi:hypothetical protein
MSVLAVKLRTAGEGFHAVEGSNRPGILDAFRCTVLHAAQ